MRTRALRCALEAEGISKSYVNSILRLALPAPDIVEAILAGRTDQGMMLEQLERPLPASWEEQRELFSSSEVTEDAVRSPNGGRRISTAQPAV